MRNQFKLAAAAAAALLCSQAWAQLTLYPQEGWRGRPMAVAKTISDLRRAGFNDRASSVVVESGRWEVCSDANFGGQCRVLRRGSYASLDGMGLDDRISSIRPVPRRRDVANYAPAPLPAPAYEYRQRPRERLYEAPVTAVRAVVGPPEQRCWIEQQQMAGSSGSGAVGAVAGAILGGVLGHQVGSGSGRDIATAGGAIAGAAVGANAGRRRDNALQEVRRCEAVQSTTPQYWDVSYEFRGVQHHAQLTHEPGRTIPVNRDGIPRL